MARLDLSLLGPFEVTLDDRPVSDFESDKVRALLAYLVVESDRPHRRDSLAGMLWADWSDRAARANLRNALANLRTAIGDRLAEPSFLLITRETIKFNPASDHWLDVTAFRRMVDLDDPVVRQLEEAVDLYRGSFLAGFFVGDSPAFEDWSLLTRERLERKVLSALYWLAEHYEQRGDYERACDYAWRQVELEPWLEAAHQQLMRLLAVSGRRGAALSQYETCRQLLAEELGVEPAGETTRLYEEIRDGTLGPAAPAALAPARSPSFLDEESSLDTERPVFVARDAELAKLEGFLDEALAGRGRVVFITGEAGSGKTALLQAFARRARDAHSDLVVPTGNCKAYTGAGDPYLPFREALQLLAGDVEAKWEAGTVAGDHARRLWNALPLTAQVLLETGPDLIDTFVPGRALVERAAAAVPGGAEWLQRLDELVGQTASGHGAQQSALFEQYASVVTHLARRRPLVLALDDLQWADVGSINLLFHLGREVAGSPLLIVGAYRPEEVALGRNGKRHPLDPVVNELRRDFGDITVGLDEADNRAFMEAFLDSEPNRLGTAFRERLFRQTRGHPLYTVELLRGLQEREDLVQDGEGRWIEGPALDWETLPARVEAVIAERVGRLPESDRQALRAGSVEGEIFTAEVVADVLGEDERELVTRLSRDLDRRHRLIRAETIERMDGQSLCRYRFRHILFQTYLLGTLDEVERMRLHEDVGRALERLYGDRAEDAAVELAHHFERAGVVEEAVAYLHRAGTKAVRLSANEEAIGHFRRALALLEDSPKSAERLETELTLHVALASPLEAAKGFTAPETAHAYRRAYELSQQIDETPQMIPTLLNLGVFYYARGEGEKSYRLTQRALDLALRAEDPVQVAITRWLLGLYLLDMGQLELARENLERVIAFYEPRQHAQLVAITAQDMGVSVLKWASWTLWLLGYPDQALERSQEALTLARELGHPYTLGFALFTGGFLHQLRREVAAARRTNEELRQLLTKQAFPLLRAGSDVLTGWTLALSGKARLGINQIREGLEACRSMGTEARRSHWLSLLAEAQAVAGDVEAGLGTLSQALDFAEKARERYYEAEIYRLRGDLLVMRSDDAEAEASFETGIELARGQRAKSWELRSTVSLCRLWREQGRNRDARERLSEVLGWFTEGFDSPDLTEARALLERLS